MSTFDHVKSTERVLEAIDEVLDSLIGREGRIAVYEYVEERFMLKKNDIPLRPETLSKVLFALFGHQVSNVIEQRIARELCRRTGMRCEPTWTLQSMAQVTPL